MQQDVGERLLGDGLAVDLDEVASLDERVQLPGLAVHEHAAGLDQLVGLAPRGDAGASEIGVQAHARILAGKIGRAHV